MHIAEPLFQPHQVLAVGGETEMPRLDNSGMHRAHRNLMQAFALRRQECIRFWLPRGCAVPQRMAHVPESEIEPSARIRRADSIVAIQIADGAFETNRRRMARADAWIGPVLADVAQHADVAGSFIQQRHVHGRGVAPQAEHCAATVCQKLNRLPPALVAHDHARPGPMPFGLFTDRDGVEHGHDAIPTTWRRSGSQ